MVQLGYIGTGAIGFGMTKNLLAAGNKVMVANRRSKDVVEKLVALGATTGTKTELAAKCDIVFLCVTNGDVTNEILFGEDGVADAMKSGSLFVEHGSVSYKQACENATQLAKRGIGYIDCPVSGAEEKALEGTLALMAGGSKEDYEKAKPYLEVMGKPILVGGVGSGCITKYVSQTICAATEIIIGETFHLAYVAGADPEKVFEAIRTGAAASWLLERNIPMILERDFTGHGYVSILHKDMYNVLETANALTCPMPMTAQMCEIFQAMIARGREYNDISGMVQYYEDFTGKVVKRIED